MKRAFFTFHGILNELLPDLSRGKTLVRRFYVDGSAKDFVESFGIPHTEVSRVLVDGDPASLTVIVCGGQQLEIFPPETVAEAVGAGPLRFVLDVHLGRLAAYLRMLGLDVAYRNDLADPDLARIAASEERILLTRDRGLLMRKEIQRGYWLRQTGSRQQLKEVVRRYGLMQAAAPFTRCMHCNTPLQRVDKAAVLDRLPPRTVSLFEDFQACPACRRIYWTGSHHGRMVRWIEELSRG